ncbi:hypothetical protein F2Q69_00000004 [Brassica cretica]|uniref:Uncharacterized protein n=1 Tax=Brassica cretica TaxID=69181 RepID=A0A8S9PJL8_BRACR|nr:hypothetical protein F2Q69_00000004 [Brassica cretica]
MDGITRFYKVGPCEWIIHGFPASRVIPVNPVRQRSTSPGRALPGLDRTQYRFGVQKRQGSFRMGGIEPEWWLPQQLRPATWTTSS